MNGKHPGTYCTVNTSPPGPYTLGSPELYIGSSGTGVPKIRILTWWPRLYVIVRLRLIPDPRRSFRGSNRRSSRGSNRRSFHASTLTPISLAEDLRCTLRCSFRSPKIRASVLISLAEDLRYAADFARRRFTRRYSFRSPKICATLLIPLAEDSRDATHTRSTQLTARLDAHFVVRRSFHG